MTETTPSGRATIKDIKEFFMEPKLTNTELIKFKKEFPDDYESIAVGIGNGTFTY